MCLAWYGNRRTNDPCLFNAAHSRNIHGLLCDNIQGRASQSLSDVRPGYLEPDGTRWVIVEAAAGEGKGGEDREGRGGRERGRRSLGEEMGTMRLPQRQEVSWTDGGSSSQRRSRREVEREGGWEAGRRAGRGQGRRQTSGGRRHRATYDTRAILRTPLTFPSLPHYPHPTPLPPSVPFLSPSLYIHAHMNYSTSYPLTYQTNINIYFHA